MAETLRASGGLSLLVLASRVLGVVRESLFAALFGGGALADAFQVAFRIPNLLRDLFAEGALSSAFVPTFTATLRQEGQARAQELAARTAAVLLLMTGTLAVLGAVFAPAVVWAISFGFAGDPDKLARTVMLTRVMMPVLVVLSVGALWMGVLNARARYLVPAAAPLVFNAVSIGVGLALWLLGYAPEVALLWWAIGTVIGALAQVFVQVPGLVRAGFAPRLRLRGAWTDPGVRRIARLMGPAVAGLAAVQVNIFVNTGLAAELGDGPVAQLAYAFRIFFLPVGMFGVALATVTTTRVSEDAAVGDREGLRARTGEGLAAAAMLTSASAVGLWWLAGPVVALVYERGRFGPGDTLAVAAVLQAYVIGLWPYAAVKLIAPALYGLDRARVPLLASLAAVAANLAFNLLTFRSLGAAGLALGTTVGAVVNVVVLRIAFGRIVGAPIVLPEASAAPASSDQASSPAPRGASGRLAALALANGAMLATLWAVERGLAAVGWPVHTAGASQPGTLWLAAQLLLSVSVAGAVFVAALRLLGYPGAAALARAPRAVLRRLRPRPRPDRAPASPPPDADP